MSAPDPTTAIERGLRVFPLPPGAKATAPGWQHTLASGSAEQIRENWPTGANIGIGCRASGIVGIDLDRHTDGGMNAGIDGIEQFAQTCARWGQPRPVTLEIATPNDGRHLLLRVPPGLTVPSVSGGRSRLGPGIDIRGPGVEIGGYLAGVGSVVNGREYVIALDAPIAPLPGWMAALIGRRVR